MHILHQTFQQTNHPLTKRSPTQNVTKKSHREMSPIEKTLSVGRFVHGTFVTITGMFGEGTFFIRSEFIWKVEI